MMPCCIFAACWSKWRAPGWRQYWVFYRWPSPSLSADGRNWYAKNITNLPSQTQIRLLNFNWNMFSWCYL